MLLMGTGGDVGDVGWGWGGMGVVWDGGWCVNGKDGK